MFNQRQPTKSDFRSIQDPQPNVESLTASVRQLKEVVEMLAGHRGTTDTRAVLWKDLVSLGLIDLTDYPPV
jgi:hypothetical protein